MEFRLDYIEREIKKLSLILNALITGLKNNDNVFEPAVKAVFDEIVEIEQLEEKDLFDYLSKNKSWNSENIKLLADIFYERYTSAPGNNQARTKALFLYQLLLKDMGGTLNLDIYNKVHLLQNH
ncbi:MAG: hypothetical protein IPH58_10185 [Sphingobacteriales bacterium]|nr:hypothetical protein [Sphingobacteriales bacterium]